MNELVKTLKEDRADSIQFKISIRTSAASCCIGEKLLPPKVEVSVCKCEMRSKERCQYTLVFPNFCSSWLKNSLR